MGIINSEWWKSNISTIKSFYSHGYSRTQIYQACVGTSMGLRKTDMLATLRAFEGQEEMAREAYRSTPLKYKPTRYQMGQAPWHQTKNYIVEADISRKEIETGDIKTWSIKLGMDEMKPREEIDDTLINYAEQYGHTFLKFESVGIWKK